MSVRLLRACGAVFLAVTMSAATATPGYAADPTPSPTPAATISGQFTEGADPVPGVAVLLQLSVYPALVARTVTDSAGAFRLDGVRPGQYKLRFELPGGLVQFYPQKTDFAAATVITVTDGQDVAISESVVPHGSLGGHITTSTRAEAPNARVELTKSDGLPFSATVADDHGAYAFAYVPAGSFKVTVALAQYGAPRQWAHQHRRFADADPVAVAVGPRTVMDEALLPLGTIVGRYTNAAGPIAGSVVNAEPTTDDGSPISANTGPDGTFRMYVYPGSYKVKFSALTAKDLDQWSTGKESERLADVHTVRANEQLELDEHALPTGIVSGRLTDAAGQPVAAAAAVVANKGLDRSFMATTDADGRWSLKALPGTYLVNFETSTQVEWATGAATPAEADPVTVTADQTTVVDDSLAEPGSLAVTATDAATGAPLTTFCADADTGFLFVSACTDDGTAEFPAVSPGDYQIAVTDGEHLKATTSGVRVDSGRASAATVRMIRGATITVTVTDADTGAPVSGVCVSGTPATRAFTPGEGIGACGGDTNQMTIDQVQPDRYLLFASIFDGVHGAQWVGPTGGVGDRAAARVITTTPGAHIDVAIRLDPAGSIAGTVTDRATGRPIDGATISTGDSQAGTDASGRYRLDGLGPYRWPVFAGHPVYAGLWSGGARTRPTATPVRVRAGQVAGFDAALGRGTMIAGTITGASGRLPDQVDVTVVNALTYDPIAVVQAGPDGRYTARVAGPQPVKLLLGADFRGVYYTTWYRDAAQFRDGRTFVVPPSGTLPLDLTVAD